MKKTSPAKPYHAAMDDMRSEYTFDYRKARPNRFAGRIDKDLLVVVLEPDIAEVFTTPESVNRVLRALITTMPRTAEFGTAQRVSTRARGRKEGAPNKGLKRTSEPRR